MKLKRSDMVSAKMLMLLVALYAAVVTEASYRARGDQFDDVLEEGFREADEEDYDDTTEPSLARGWWCGRDRDCIWSAWTAWGDCSKPCGGGVRKRTRSILQHGSCKGRSCTGGPEESIECNKFCHNGGYPANGYCRCPPNYHGACCEWIQD